MYQRTSYDQESIFWLSKEGKSSIAIRLMAIRLMATRLMATRLMATRLIATRLHVDATAASIERRVYFSSSKLRI
jgi:hypothetical protein